MHFSFFRSSKRQKQLQILCELNTYLYELEDNYKTSRNLVADETIDEQIKLLHDIRWELHRAKQSLIQSPNGKVPASAWKTFKRLHEECSKELDQYETQRQKLHQEFFFAEPTTFTYKRRGFFGWLAENF